MSLERTTLKRAAVSMLDAVALEHPAGHQQGKAARYILQAASGREIEVMLEKDDASSANLWMTIEAAGALVGGSIAQDRSPASTLFSEIGKDGMPSYGRHSGLKRMPQLARADLVRFVPRNLEELGRIIDQALAASTTASSS
ncbi:hypothetical protein GVN21_13025 [Caulobacter sp. SLTY]|uniref:hypothetical protein n=1 Tax=Caulobacter sp. SLTY TaxID=2683262 RepID=UPI0014136FF8|nr:hypothetical protein [Caulobacter sp. SLTY]NBB16282.1 hypothetical protein [Caulobacter sp. SLTY]